MKYLKLFGSRKEENPHPGSHSMNPSVYLLFFPALVIIACHQDKENQRPNIVILFTDDQGTIDANCYGSKDLYTPNIDSLARNGVLFTQAYAHTVCCPSRAAMLTGRYPQRSGINSWTQGDAHEEEGVNMHLDEITLAEVLSKAGYNTGLFGKWHLGADLDHGPLSQGFHVFFGFRGGFIDNYIHYFLHGKGFHDLYQGKEEIFCPGAYFPEEMTNKAVQFIDNNNNHPFFLYVSFNLPHYPYQWVSEFDSIYEDLPMPRQAYARTVSTVDGKIGEIISALRKNQLLENTLVIFASDNGHSTEDYEIKSDEHSSGLPIGHNYGAQGGGGYTGKWRGAKDSFFEGGIRVPTIVSFPGRFPEGESRDQVITNMDFFPTICDLLKLPLPENPIDGHSMLPVIYSSEEASAYDVLYFQWFDRWAVREGNWKLVGNGWDTTDKFAGKKILKRKMDSLFLANLEDENPEEINYADQHPVIVARLISLHEEWLLDVQGTTGENE